MILFNIIKYLNALRPREVKTLQINCFHLKRAVEF